MIDVDVDAAAAVTADELRIAAAHLHNGSEEGPEGPWMLLPLDDDVLIHFVNKLHCDRSAHFER